MHTKLFFRTKKSHAGCVAYRERRVMNRKSAALSADRYLDGDQVGERSQKGAVCCAVHERKSYFKLIYLSRCQAICMRWAGGKSFPGRWLSSQPFCATGCHGVPQWPAFLGFRFCHGGCCGLGGYWRCGRLGGGFFLGTAQHKTDDFRSIAGGPEDFTAIRFQCLDP